MGDIGNAGRTSPECREPRLDSLRGARLRDSYPWAKPQTKCRAAKRTQPRTPWRRPSYQSQSVARSRPGASRESVLRVSSVGPEEKSRSLKSARSTTREEAASHGDIRRRTRGNGARQLRADRAR